MANIQSAEPITLEAGGDLSAAQWTFVKLSSGQVVQCDSAGENAIGVLGNKPSAQGEAAEVYLLASGGVLKIQSDGTVTAGDEIQTSADGQALNAAASDYILGVAIDGTSTAGELVRFIPWSANIHA